MNRAGIRRDDSHPASIKVAVLCGGVGAARFLRGLLRVVDPALITAIVNTGDDAIINGLSVSPDLDTVVYTTAEAIDPERGWGLADETWRAIDSLDRYNAVRPDGSTAACTWFRLGDRDLATHLYRTSRLDEGARLTEVTAEIATAWGLDYSVLPMSDEPVSTMVTLADSGETVGFQEYFVKLRHNVAVSSVAFDHDGASLTAAANAALVDADVIVVAPSNPLVSIGPIRALPGVDEILERRRERVVAVSPIVGGAALKGPAARLMQELGVAPTVVGVAELYAPIASVLVIDPVDEALGDDVAAAGMTPAVIPSVMTDTDAATDLAGAVVRTIADQPTR